MKREFDFYGLATTRGHTKLYYVLKLMWFSLLSESTLEQKSQDLIIFKTFLLDKFLIFKCLPILISEFFFSISKKYRDKFTKSTVLKISRSFSQDKRTNASSQCRLLCNFTKVTKFLS